MNIKLISTLITTLLILTACSNSGSRQPDWLNNQSEQYPHQVYLSGHGQSEYRAIAKDRARADLSKTFEVKLFERSEDITEFKTQKTSSGKQQSQLKTDSSRNITAQTEQIVRGIRIAEIWQDPVSSQYHALAVLDRIKMSNTLKQTINQQDSAIAKEITLAQNKKELLIKIGHSNNALKLQKSRDNNQKVLSVLDSIGIGVPPRYQYQTLLVDRNALLSRLHIASEITQSSNSDIEPIVTGALAHAGFQHENNESKANYILMTTLKIDEHQDNDGWYWQRGTLQINLKNIETQQQSGSHRWEIKVSAQNEALSKQRVLDAVDATLKSELRTVIVQFGTTK